MSAFHPNHRRSLRLSFLTSICAIGGLVCLPVIATAKSFRLERALDARRLPFQLDARWKLTPLKGSIRVSSEPLNDTNRFPTRAIPA